MPSKQLVKKCHQLYKNDIAVLKHQKTKECTIGQFIFSWINKACNVQQIIHPQRSNIWIQFSKYSWKSFCLITNYLKAGRFFWKRIFNLELNAPSKLAMLLVRFLTKRKSRKSDPFVQKRSVWMHSARNQQHSCPNWQSAILEFGFWQRCK